MDFRPLKHFLMLADSLHFGRASEACHVSPSTLSRSIRQLEQQLGVVLFNRDNRHVVLTPQGKRFQRYAKEALEEWEQVRLSLQSEAKRLSGAKLHEIRHGILVHVLEIFASRGGKISFIKVPKPHEIALGSQTG